MFLAVLTWIPLLFGGLFQSCVMERPPEQAQANPTFLSRKADVLWQSLSLHLISEIQNQHQILQTELLTHARKLPPGSMDLPDLHVNEEKIEGTYGQLPVVIVDRGEGMIFPQPVHPPARYSWFQIAQDSRSALRGLARFRIGLETWRQLGEAERVRHAGEVTSIWSALGAEIMVLARQARYLTTWVPQLTAQWVGATGSLPPQYTLIHSLQKTSPKMDPRHWDELREVMRPHRVLKRPFLPQIPRGVLTLPIATDISDRRFLAEVEGALATHWNQSVWARSRGVSFRIRWLPVARDVNFSAGRIGLNEHLERFPVTSAGMTTGGVTTYVRGHVLVLGPGRINPRTLAHEIGHLLGFSDCYLRTLSGQGFFGAAVLEWDNPLYPDDLMCDNSVGVVRAEVW